MTIAHITATNPSQKTQVPADLEVNVGDTFELTPRVEPVAT